jgi:hypothetical protein
MKKFFFLVHEKVFLYWVITIMEIGQKDNNNNETFFFGQDKNEIQQCV